VVLTAVPAEDHSLGVDVENVGPDRLERIGLASQDPDVDATVVVAVSSRHMRELSGCAQVRARAADAPMRVFVALVL